ncbi:ribosome biogenesis protein SLX9 homolog [Toxorhynchites rutilus septentrionalis]|uniref:ribosome biogenesis protein SLX9 homolog n=1 Tax=Toxorhynchites rutilus septentrionalis TaxID=329112 RepID=UPI00247980E0|nr:ribosome biogenesis protein SLX9 homolog [Toxorhynchites rutilus septentrionalis]
MGKLNKKLTLSKGALKTSTDTETKSVSGPFPIYRSNPVQLNGPEPKSFKIPPKASKIVKPNLHPAETKTVINDKEDKTPIKSKKIRKVAITRMNKKDKKKFRKEEVLKKIELTQKAFKDDKDRKKREKTAVTGDMRPLLDALPSLDSLFKLKPADTLKTGVPKYDKKAVPKTKQQLKAAKHKENKREFLNRCQKVNQVLKSRKFKKDPKKMIAEHIRNSRKEQIQLLLGS